MAIAVLLLASLLYAAPGTQTLQPSFGDPEDQAAADLIATQSAASADDYRSLDPTGKAAFLSTYWDEHCPKLLKYYYGYHLGQRRYSISASYFDRFNKLPKPFRSGQKPLDPEMVTCALDHTRFLLSRSPDDPIAHCATGYLHLELGDFNSASGAFQRALGKDRHLAEARYGLGLSLLMQPGKISRAAKVMQEALAEDRDYVDIYYALSVANIVLLSPVPVILSISHRLPAVARHRYLVAYLCHHPLLAVYVGPVQIAPGQHVRSWALELNCCDTVSPLDLLTQSQ